MQILWPSRVCDCSFVLEFDPDRDSLTRPYKAISWGPDEEELESPYEAYPSITEVRSRDACSIHDDDDVERAFGRVLQEHVERGYGEDYRKITVIGWTSFCGCVTTKQVHGDGFDGGSHIIGPTLRRCDAHFHLEGTGVFRQVRTESVQLSRAFDAIRKACVPALEPSWTMSDGRKVWERDIDPSSASAIRIICGDPFFDLREHPTVSVRPEDRQIEVVLPKSLAEYAERIQEQVPESIVRVG